MARKVSGSLTATGASAEVIGIGASYQVTGTFVGTVALQYHDGAAWQNSRSHTAVTTNNPNVITDVARRRWRMNCSAFTSGSIDYVLDSAG
jgi:hypothetical protein